MLDTTRAAWTLLKGDAKSHFSVQSFSPRPFHFDGARCARAFFFLKRIMKKNRLLRARRLRVFAFFRSVSFFTSGVFCRTYRMRKCIRTPRLSLRLSFCFAPSRDLSLRAHDPEDRVACEVCQSRRANMEQTFVTVKGSAMLSSFQAQQQSHFHVVR